jgi:hypothetical protein
VQTSDRGRFPISCTVAIMNTVLTTPQPPDTTCNTGHHGFEARLSHGRFLPYLFNSVFNNVHNMGVSFVLLAREGLLLWIQRCRVVPSLSWLFWVSLSPVPVPVAERKLRNTATVRSFHLYCHVGILVCLPVYLQISVFLWYQNLYNGPVQCSSVPVPWNNTAALSFLGFVSIKKYFHSNSYDHPSIRLYMEWVTGSAVRLTNK